MQVLELSPPVKFEPVGLVTAVFFDEKNQQVFSVRSGGATGVIIRSPVGGTQSIPSCRISDEGPILSVKLSPGQDVLSLQRSKNSVEFITLTPGGGGEYTRGDEYSQQARTKNCVILGYIWTSETEVVIVTDIGIEIYSVNKERKIIKYIRSSSVGSAWYISSHVGNILVTAPKLETSLLQVWVVRNSTLYRIGQIDLISPLVDKDISLLEVYSTSFLRVNIRKDEVVHEIHLYSVASDQVIKSHVLTGLACSGPVGVHILDNLILVHSQSQGNTWLYDIQLETSTTKSADDLTVVKPASPDPTSITDRDGNILTSYPPGWVLFLPNTLVDARLGLMWTLGMKLNQVVDDLPESPDNLINLTRFLLHRETGKVPLLQLLSKCVHCENVKVPTISNILHCVVRVYQLHQTSNGFVPVVLDQSDIFTNVLSLTVAQDVPMARLESVVLEYLLCLDHQSLSPRQFLHELLITLCVKTNRFYQLHQMIQYHVIGDSKQIACLLLSLESVYRPARQLALDMMTRLGTAVEEIIEIFLAEGKLISALTLVEKSGLVDTISARKFLEAAEKTGNKMVFYNVFSFFEERNLRVRGSGKFSRGEQCDGYVDKFKLMFLGDNLE